LTSRDVAVDPRESISLELLTGAYTADDSDPGLFKFDELDRERS
jgi:hypothetical protein